MFVVFYQAVLTLQEATRMKSIFATEFVGMFISREPYNLFGSTGSGSFAKNSACAGRYCTAY